MRYIIYGAGAVGGTIGGRLFQTGQDVILMAQTEVGEVGESAEAGRGGSSTMPHKQNPIRCEAIIGAAATLRAQVPVIILSDTFEQFAQPLMRQLGWPTLFCHRLIVTNDRITGYQLRMSDQKRHAVAALQALNYNVIAAGDSFNDTTMLGQADAGFLFHAPENVIAQFPQFPALHDYTELLTHLKAAQ